MTIGSAVRVQGSQWLRPVAMVLAGSAALAVSAKVEVPFWPVPMTMQSLAVLLIGLGYGWRLGIATVLAYLAEGAAGLPVFAGPAAGLGYLAGPTGGYLAGFVLAAGLAGWLGARGIGRVSLAMVLGHAVIFALGVAWLAGLLGWPRAVALGFMPFLAGTVVKCALGVALVLAARRSRGTA